MQNKNIKLTDEQLKTINVLFKALETLAKDTSFKEKLAIAYKMEDEDITSDNEEDFMELINFRENVIEVTNNSFE